MLVQQTARFLHQQKQARLLLKLDITKAFDSVSWPFLIEVLQKLGFGQVWRDIICGLLSSSSTRVMLNGFPGDLIYHRRGLRQGDPLSPMLFILVMDVLGQLFIKAEEEGLLQSLSSRRLQHRISFYADDVVLFLHPIAEDIGVTLDILNLFGEASGLRNNAQKTNVYPIRCSEEDLTLVQELLPCELSEFPCRYLGLPLSLRKLTREQLQPIIDRLGNQLPGWKADLMTRAGRRVQVQFVLTGMLIYSAMALDLPAWALKAIDKIRKGFLWPQGGQGGHCLVAWDKVCRPLELGGLGISSLTELNWALRMRWLWLEKTEPGRPWAALPIQVPNKVRDFFAMTLQTEIGNGESTLFWSDRWLHGQRIADIAPRLFAIIPKRRIKKRTVHDALVDRSWISDIQGALTVGAIVDYLHLWNILSDFELQPNVADTHLFRLAANGKYSAKAAYEGLFIGSVQFEPFERIWKTWAPPKCRFFMWLTAHKRCWTADRLAKRGLDHPGSCPLCDQESETIDHLLAACVFAREFWFCLLRQFGLQMLCPQPGTLSFLIWWQSASEAVVGLTRRGLNTLIVLGAWILWNHRNRCVFDGGTPSLAAALVHAGEERRVWEMAGAKGLRFLSAPLPGD